MCWSLPATGMASTMSVAGEGPRKTSPGRWWGHMCCVWARVVVCMIRMSVCANALSSKPFVDLCASSLTSSMLTDFTAHLSPLPTPTPLYPFSFYTQEERDKTADGEHLQQAVRQARQARSGGGAACGRHGLDASEAKAATSEAGEPSGAHELAGVCADRGLAQQTGIGRPASPQTVRHPVRDSHRRVRSWQPGIGVGPPTLPGPTAFSERLPRAQKWS